MAQGKKVLVPRQMTGLRAPVSIDRRRNPTPEVILCPQCT